MRVMRVTGAGTWVLSNSETGDTRFTVGLEQKASLIHPFHCWASLEPPLFTRFTVGQEPGASFLHPFHCWARARSLPFHPFHCWARKEAKEARAASQKERNRGKRGPFCLPEGRATYLPTMVPGIPPWVYASFPPLVGRPARLLSPCCTRTGLYMHRSGV